MTNEERFIASCASVGEADVRQKLSAGRYSERRTVWATNWLEQLDNGKSDATKAEERSGSLLAASGPARPSTLAYSALLVVILLAGVVALLAWRPTLL